MFFDTSIINDLQIITTVIPCTSCGFARFLYNYFFNQSKVALSSQKKTAYY